MTWFTSSMLLLASAILYACSPPDRPGIDVWAYQQRLMKISDQRMPSTPVITKEVLMYYALILEESAELAAALGKTISSRAWALGLIRSNLFDVAEGMTAQSQEIRRLLTLTSLTFEITASDGQMQEILDGATDLAVVNAGFALAAGLPARAAYLEVATSNLSKVNPVTGMIDKDPSGKWIKGVNYKQPDLGRVLQEAREEAMFGPARQCHACN